MSVPETWEEYIEQEMDRPNVESDEAWERFKEYRLDQEYDDPTKDY